MSDYPYARQSTTDYENVIATCPLCDEENIFNRASDLKTFEKISPIIVECQHCRKRFKIESDSINPTHEMLLFECFELLNRKRYMQTVLTVGQAYEVFAAIYLRAELLYRPFAIEESPNIEQLNVLSKLLYNKTKKWTFHKMRAAVLWHLVQYDEPHSTLNEAKKIIQGFSNPPSEPRNAKLDRFKDHRLRRFAKAFKGTNINTLRNKVMHKAAYRPTREEAVQALGEAEYILHLACHLLGIFDDINMYLRDARGGVSREKQ